MRCGAGDDDDDDAFSKVPVILRDGGAVEMCGIHWIGRDCQLMSFPAPEFSCVTRNVQVDVVSLWPPLRLAALGVMQVSHPHHFLQLADGGSMCGRIPRRRPQVFWSGPVACVPVWMCEWEVMRLAACSVLYLRQDLVKWDRCLGRAWRQGTTIGRVGRY